MNGSNISAIPHDLLSTSFDVGNHRFPGYWRFLLPKEFASLKLPEEKIADCTACPMVSVGAYDARCRCCTHIPQIANYQLGTALSERNDAIQKMIQQGYALPEGIDLHPEQQRLFHSAYSQGRFGLDESLRCPLMDVDTGMCDAYMYRTSVCSTFFCSNDHGDSGARFWDGLKQLISQIDLVVAQWAMAEVGMDVPAYMDRKNSLVSQFDRSVSGFRSDSPGAIARGWPKEIRSFMFGEWFGREDTFFEKCSQVVWQHKNELWTIAENAVLYEASAYERAVEAYVQGNTVTGERDVNNATDAPQVEADDAGIGELWEELLDAYENLWRLPGSDELLVLNPDVVFLENACDDKVSRFFSSKEFCVFLSKPENEGEAAILYISADEVSVLHLFDKPTALTDELLKQSPFQNIGKARAFLAQSVCNGLLEIRAAQQ
ncbi:MAG: hypothetical protein JXX29_24095 [Deltaproteobacteria bacterium]|nr:hypothetical protein [Deltaproteobacteria bacterium]MBN2674785.1 hypothetical protein [Deltaproteobacteria bacterium]